MDFVVIESRSCIPAKISATTVRKRGAKKSDVALSRCTIKRYLSEKGYFCANATKQHLGKALKLVEKNHLM